MKKHLLTFLIVFMVLMPIMGNDFLITKFIETKAIPCKILNISNDFVRFSNKGKDYIWEIKSNFVHKVVFGEESDTIIISRLQFNSIEVQNLQIKNGIVSYKDVKTGNEQYLNVNELAYIDFVTYDSIKFVNYKKLADKLAMLQYLENYVQVKTAESINEANILEFDGEKLKIAFNLKADKQQDGYIARINVKEILFSNIKNVDLGLQEGKLNIHTIFSKGEIIGKTNKIDNNNLEVQFSENSNTTSAIFRRDDLITIENKNVRKIVEKEINPGISRYSFNIGYGNNNIKIPAEIEKHMTQEAINHQKKIRNGISLSTSYFKYAKSGHGVGVAYSMFYSGAKTNGIAPSIFDTITTKGEVNEKHFSHFVGLSYSYISNTSILKNRDVIRFSIGPGLLYNNFPTELKYEKNKEEKTQTIKVKSYTLGINAVVGYDIIFDSYKSIGFELSYTYSRINQIRVNGNPVLLSDDFIYRNNRIEFSIGFRFY